MESTSKYRGVAVGVLRQQLFPPNDYRTRFFLSIAGLYILLSIGLIFLKWSVDRNVLLLTAIPIWLYFGAVQYVLAQSLHEAWHFHFAGGTGFACRLLISYPLFIPTAAKNLHFDHHKHLGIADLDPDYSAYGKLPATKRAFWTFLFYGVSGISAALRLRQLLKSAPHGKADPKKRGYAEILSLLLSQVCLFVVFYTVVGPLYYFFFWLSPLGSLVKPLVNLRLIAEHGTSEGNGAGLRSFQGWDPISGIIGAYGFSRHAEHHLLPNYQYLDLEKVRLHILSTEVVSDLSTSMIEVEYASESYLGYLRKLYGTLP